MKRVRVAPGKYIAVSAEMEQKASRVFSTRLTPEQVRTLKVAEPRLTSGLMLGKSKPLSISRPKGSLGLNAAAYRLPNTHEQDDEPDPD